MTSRRAVTGSALADMNTLEAPFFLIAASSLCHLVGGDFAAFVRDGRQRLHACWLAHWGHWLGQGAVF